MNALVKSMMVATVGVIVAACSPQQASSPAASTPAATAATVATPSASAPATHASSASALTMQAPPAGATSDDAPLPPPAHGPSLDAILQRGDFAQAFAAINGAASLPAWVAHAGSATPSERVTIDGKPMWLVQTCGDADCQSGQLLLLVDPAAHAMHGLFVANSGGSGASVQKLTWLGTPDAAQQALLAARAARD